MELKINIPVLQINDELTLQLLHHQSVLPKGRSFTAKAQQLRLQFCRRQVFQHKVRNQVCNFTRDWIGAVASLCNTNVLNYSDLSPISEAEYEFENFPMLIKWRKNEFQKFLSCTIF